MSAADDKTLNIGGRSFGSRLLVGTGKFASPHLMRDALDATGGEIVTVALRRADLSGAKDPFANILEFIDPKKFLVLPNTSGAMDAQEAIRLARLAAAAGLPKWVKLEIHPDPRYLLPDPVETLKAAEQLVSEGFTVWPYINADPVLAKRLQAVGTATVMPLGSPIGSIRGWPRALFALSLNKLKSRWWWMQVWEHPVMQPKPWSWEPMRFSSTRRLLFARIRFEWRWLLRRPCKRVVKPMKSVWVLLRARPTHRVR